MILHLCDSFKHNFLVISVILFSKPGDLRSADSINFNDPDDFSDSCDFSSIV